METHWEVGILCKVTTLHWIFNKMTEFTKCLEWNRFFKNKLMTSSQEVKQSEGVQYGRGKLEDLAQKFLEMEISARF